jgi:type II secretory pathway component PulF
MSKQHQVRFASAVLGAAALLMAAFLFLNYYVPMLEQMWADSGDTLPASQRILFDASRSVRELGLYLFLPLAGFLVAALVGRIITAVQLHRQPNKPMT